MWGFARRAGRCVVVEGPEGIAFGGGQPARHGPDWGALYGMVADLNQAVSGLEATQRRIFKVTGVAWSDDRMVKAVVGPRGQLIDLEIDPRVYRKPNSKALAATILVTVRRAVEDATRRTQEILDESVAGDLRVGTIGGLDVRRLIQTHDDDLPREEGEGDEFVVR
jgi:DNA-binding protein YbaB